MRTPDYTSLDLVVNLPLRDHQAASQHMLFLPKRQHALMSGWGGPPQSRTLCIEGSSTVETTISYRVPPGVTHIDMEVDASGNGNVNFSTAVDTTGIDLHFIDAFSADPGTELSTTVRTNGLQVLAAAEWEWTDVDIAVEVDDVLSTYTLTIYPRHVPRGPSAAIYSLAAGDSLLTRSGPFTGDVLLSFWFRVDTLAGDGPIAIDGGSDAGFKIEDLGATYEVQTPLDYVLNTFAQPSGFHHAVVWSSAGDLYWFLDGLELYDGLVDDVIGRVVFGGAENPNDLSIANVAYVQRTYTGPASDDAIEALFAAGRNWDPAMTSGAWTGANSASLLAHWFTALIDGEVASRGATDLPLVFAPAIETAYIPFNGTTAYGHANDAATDVDDGEGWSLIVKQVGRVSAVAKGLGGVYDANGTFPRNVISWIYTGQTTGDGRMATLGYRTGGTDNYRIQNADATAGGVQVVAVAHRNAATRTARMLATKAGATLVDQSETMATGGGARTPLHVSIAQALSGTHVAQAGYYGALQFVSCVLVRGIVTEAEAQEYSVAQNAESVWSADRIWGYWVAAEAVGTSVPNRGSGTSVAMTLVNANASSLVSL